MPGIEDEEDAAEEALRSVENAEELYEDLKHYLETNDLEEANRTLDELKDLEERVRLFVRVTRFPAFSHPPPAHTRLSRMIAFTSPYLP